MPTRTPVEVMATPFRGSPTKFKAIHILSVMLDHPEGIWEPKMRNLVNGSSTRNRHFKDVVQEMRETGIIYVDSTYKGLPIYKLQTTRGAEQDKTPTPERNVKCNVGGAVKYFVVMDGVKTSLRAACEAKGFHIKTVYNIMSRLRDQGEPEGELPQKAIEHVIRLKEVNQLRGGSNRFTVKRDHTRTHEPDPVFAGVNSIFSLGESMR